MKAQDILSYSFSAIKLRKLRAGLTTLGVVIGIAAIVALLSITQGLQAAITDQLKTGFATDTLIVSTGGGFGGFGAGAQGGTGANSGFKLLVNYTQMINNLTNVETSMAIIQRTGRIEFNQTVQNVTIVGVDFAEYASIYSSTFVPENGTIPTNPENEMIVVGKRVSAPGNNDTLFCSVNDTVEMIWTNATKIPPTNETYAGKVTAVLKEIGGFGIIGPSDTDVYIPISQAQSFFGTEECNSIIVKLASDDQASIDNATQAIKAAFSNEVSVTSATAVLSILSNVFSVIQLFLGGIAAISLLVAGIGIMNIMIVSLMERTREIGILKALGMKGQTVLLIFLCESVIIGLIGAAIGIGSGWVLANVVALVFRGGGVFGGNRAANTGGMTITPLLTPTVTILALVFGVGVSAIFALYPAWRASKLKPVEALRYE
ncbi:MAG: FtsX-like permease family protein [Candidatus Bathyarchaeia archaeon]